MIGVCPQHDLLWDEMTGVVFIIIIVITLLICKIAKEHLEFFCKFKGIPENMIAQETAHRLEMVGMTEVAHIPTRAFSGGEKRRLSVALGISVFVILFFFFFCTLD